MAVKWFEMDETQLICTGWIPEFDSARMVVIDFLPAPPNMDLRSTASKSLSSGDATAWRFTLAKEINETVTLFNDMHDPTKQMKFKIEFH